MNKVGPIMFAFIGLVVYILLTAGTACAADWPMYRHDPMRTGVSEDIVEPPLELLWSRSLEYGHIHALDAATGNEKWKTSIGHSSGWGGRLSSPAVVNNTVYIGSDDRCVYALDATTGDVKWKYSTAGMIVSSPAVLDGVVYIGSTDLYLYALDAKTGEEIWTYKTFKEHGGVSSTPAISDGKLFMDLYVIDVKTGEMIDTLPACGHVSPVIHNGAVYFARGDYIIAADNSETNNEIWNFKLDQKEVGCNCADSGITVTEDTIYCVSQILWTPDAPETEEQKAYLYALNATTGKKKWKREIDCEFCSPTISGDTVYIGSYILDAVTGDEKGKFREIGSEDLSYRYLKELETVVAGGVIYRAPIGVAVSGDTVYAVGDVYAYTSPNAVIAPSTSHQSSSTRQTTLESTDNTHTTTQDDQTTKNNLKNWFLIAASLLLIAIAIFTISKRKSKKEKPPTKIVQGSIDIKREYNVLANNNLNLKISVTNNTGYAVMDAKSILDYPPTLFSIKSSKVQSFGNLNPNESKTAAYILTPLGCIHKEVLDAIITYQDHTGEKQTLEMQPLDVHCVCPFLKGKAMVSGEFARLADKSESIQEGISFSGIRVEDVSDIIRKICVPRLHVISEHELDNTKVIDLSGESIGEKAYYLLTAIIQPYNEKDITQIALRAYSDKPYGLRGFLNEIGNSIRYLVGSVQSAKEIGIIENKQVINIIDSVVQRTSFGETGEGATSVNIEGSIVQRSQIGLAKKCPSCGKEVQGDEKFCEECGTELGE